MKHTHIKLLSLAIASLTTLFASQSTTAQEIFSSEFAPYEMRKDAETGTRSQHKFYSDFTPKAINSSTYNFSFSLPEMWSDRAIILHLEGVASAYDLTVNNQSVAAVEDSITPSQFDISRYISSGANSINVSLRESKLPLLEAGVETPKPTTIFEGSYLVARHKVGIVDYDVTLTPDPTAKFGVLDVAIQVGNGFNYDENVEVGYDIYDPAGKLHEFNTSKLTLKGGAKDTISFRPYIYKTYTGSNLWSPTNPKLYRVTLYVKRNGILTDYIPLRLGFGETTFRDGSIMRFGKSVDLKSTRYNASATKAMTLREIKSLKAKGFNTLRPDYPQPLWFYDLCDKVGLWVVDQININSTKSPNDRTIGGTPANNPTLLDEYILRAKRAYFRSRNFNCVVGYSLGGDTSGNGYNMQKVYKWLKGVETKRPIVYTPAREEWNSDYINTL